MEMERLGTRMFMCLKAYTSCPAFFFGQLLLECLASPSSAKRLVVDLGIFAFIPRLVNGGSIDWLVLFVLP